MEPSQCASSQYIPYRPTCPRDRFQECKTLAKTRHEHVTFYRCTECVDFFFFSPKEKIRFSKLGWGSAHWGTAFFHSPTLLVLILLLEGKGKEAAFLKPHTSRAFSRVCCEVTPSGSCRQYSDGSRRKQKRETVLKSHEHPTRETQDETKGQVKWKGLKTTKEV